MWPSVNIYNISTFDLLVIWGLIDLTTDLSVNVTLKECLWTCKVVSHPQMTSNPPGKLQGMKCAGGGGCFSHKGENTRAGAPYWGLRSQYKGRFSCDGWVWLRCQAPLGQSPQQGRHHLGTECQGWPKGGDLCPNLRFKRLRLTQRRRGGNDSFPPL